MKWSERFRRSAFVQHRQLDGVLERVEALERRVTALEAGRPTALDAT